MNPLANAGELIRGIWSGVLDLVYPPKCLICESFQPHYLCPECTVKIQKLGDQICGRCGYPVEQLPCMECRGRELYFDTARSVAAYEDPLKEAIHLLKFKGLDCLAPELSLLMTEYIKSERPAYTLRKADVIIAVPIDKERLLERGFNQSELFARDIAAALGKPVLRKELVRAKRRPPQSSLSYEERLINLSGAFAVSDNAALAGKRVLLLDDVYTTGSTANEAARVLKEAGAVEVYVFTLARSL